MPKYITAMLRHTKPISCALAAALEAARSCYKVYTPISSITQQSFLECTQLSVYTTFRTEVSIFGEGMACHCTALLSTV